jgi:uncharacterized protein
MDDWKQLSRGVRWNFTGPQSRIQIEVVAGGLSKICRFAGCCDEFYSVAQHSVLVAQQADRLARCAGMSGAERIGISQAALLHDAHEIITGDIPSPFLRLAAYHGFGLKGLVKEQQERLERALGFQSMPWMADIVKEADMLVLAAERRDLVAGGPEWASLAGINPAPVREIEPMYPDRAYSYFLDAWYTLNKYTP